MRLLSDGDRCTSGRSCNPTVAGWRRHLAECSDSVSSLQRVQGSAGVPRQSPTGVSWSVATVVVAGPVRRVVREAQHTEPVWRGRSNFVIAAEIEGDESVAIEQLFARQIGPVRFELCCIPFFLYDVALGDVVETDKDYLVRRVVVPSGRYVFRIWFAETAQRRDEITAKLSHLGALIEWSSVNLLAVDARDHAHAQEVANYLAAAEAEGLLMFETGRSAL